jgi:hypothetical protein
VSKLAKSNANGVLALRKRDLRPWDWDFLTSLLILCPILYYWLLWYRALFVCVAAAAVYASVQDVWRRHAMQG